MKGILRALQRCFGLFAQRAHFAQKKLGLATMAASLSDRRAMSSFFQSQRVLAMDGLEGDLDGGPVGELVFEGVSAEVVFEVGEGGPGEVEGESLGGGGGGELGLVGFFEKAAEAVGAEVVFFCEAFAVGEEGGEEGFGVVVAVLPGGVEFEEGVGEARLGEGIGVEEPVLKLVGDGLGGEALCEGHGGILGQKRGLSSYY